MYVNLSNIKNTLRIMVSYRVKLHYGFKKEIFDFLFM